MARPIVEPPLDRDQRALWLGPLAAILVLALAGCSGTRLIMSGTVCGQAVELAMVDRKDRSGFEAKVTCPDGGSVLLTSSDSSTSQVIQAQAELATRLTALAEILARSVPIPPATYDPGMAARGTTLEQLAYDIETEFKE